MIPKLKSFNVSNDDGMNKRPRNALLRGNTGVEERMELDPDPLREIASLQHVLWGSEGLQLRNVNGEDLIEILLVRRNKIWVDQAGSVKYDVDRTVCFETRDNRISDP